MSELSSALSASEYYGAQAHVSPYSPVAMYPDSDFMFNLIGCGVMGIAGVRFYRTAPQMTHYHFQQQILRVVCS